MKLLFGVQAVSSRSRRASTGLCSNFLKEPAGDSYVLVARPGLEKVANFEIGPIRKMKQAGGKLYVVSDNKLFEVNTLWQVTELGTLATFDTEVSMSYDGTHVVIVDTYGVYTYDTTDGTFARNSDADILPNPTHVVFSDGFHFINDSSTGQIATHETPYAPDGSWNALDFATAEYAPDDLISMVADHGNIFLLGERTTEVWEYDPNSSALPLRPIRSAYMEYGTAAAYSPIQFDNSVVWLARDGNGQGVAVRANGWTPQIISTPELHREWGTYEKMSDAFSEVWWIEGHPLWILTFPDADKTWVYDSSSQSWSEFNRYFEDITKRGRMSTRGSAFFNNQIVTGDFRNGNLYTVSFDTQDDDGKAILCTADSQKIWDGDRRMFHSRIDLFFERGVGLTDDANQGHNPQVRLQYSNDDGNTWKDCGWKDIGKKGEYEHRVYWTRLGSARTRIYRITVSDPVEWLLSGGEIDVA